MDVQEDFSHVVPLDDHTGHKWSASCKDFYTSVSNFFLVNCGYDAVGIMMQHLYTGVIDENWPTNPRVDNVHSITNGKVIKFS